MNKNALIISLFILLLHQTAEGQPINFQQLNVTLGLSDNNVKAIATDQTGFIWIGTGNGLNLYDGNRVTHFKKEKNPALCSDDINSLLCDSRNRIWIGSDEGVTMLDEQRRFHRIILHDTLKTVSVNAIINHRVHGVILLTKKGFFSFNEKNKQWWLMEFSKTIVNETYSDVTFFSPDTLMISSDFKTFTVIDLNRQRIILRGKMKSVTAACRLNDSTVFMGFTFGKMQLWNIRTQKTEQEFTTGNIGNQSSSSINDVQTAADGSIIISSGYSGVYIFNPATGQFRQYLHEPYNPFSPVANNTDEIFCENNGNVYVNTSEAGLTWFNVKNYAAVHVPVFKDAGNRLYDNYINQLVKDNNDWFWLAAFDHLIEWNPVTNSSKFYYYPHLVKGVGQRNIEIKTVCIDQNGKLWTGTRGGGLGVLDTATGKFQIYNNVYAGKDSAYRHNYIQYLILDREGWIWAGGYKGVYKINPVTGQTDLLANHPCSQLLGKRVNIIYQDHYNRIWFGTSNHGAWRWDPSSNSIINYTTAQGLLSDNCTAFLQSKEGTLFIGTSKGISVIKNDSVVRNLTSANGLRVDRCEGLLEDDEGNIWISNGNCIICYDPVHQSFRYFDEKKGLSPYGFHAGAYYKDDNGDLFWGSNKGINYFRPQQMLQLSAHPHPVIYKLTIGDSVSLVTSAHSFQLPYSSNNIIFHYATVNVPGSRTIFYQYRLEGADKNWTKVIDQYEVRYNALSPGKYVFHLKASADGINWMDSDYPVTITIRPPWWLRWWVITGTSVFVSLLVYGWVKYREKQIRKKEAEKREQQKLMLENQQKALEAKLQSLRLKMNPHFLFNALNSIQQMILAGEETVATRFLSKFSKLLRLILINSDKQKNLLQEELEILNLYIELESIRFKGAFHYEIVCDEEVDTEETTIPTLLLQPLVENAIWHGLMHKEGDRKLRIHFSEIDNQSLACTIEDNGIGRQAAAAIREHSLLEVKHTGKGILVAQERLNVLDEKENARPDDPVGRGKSSMEIIDLFDEQRQAAGTRVIIKIPLIS